MRRIIVNAQETVLVYRRGSLERVLSKGVYWILSSRQIERFTMKDRFTPNNDINMLLQHEALSSLLDVIEVGDNEIAIRYKDGRFQSILNPGKYAYWKGHQENEFQIIDMNKIEVNPAVERKVLDRTSMSPYILKVKVESFEKAIQYVDGKFNQVLEAGTYYFWKAVRQIEIVKVEMRKQVLELTGQEILTKDKAAIRVNIYAQYQITDIMKAKVEIKDYGKQMYSILQLAFRAYIGKLTLDELLAKKAEISLTIIDEIEAQFSDLGIEILNAGIKDIILPGEIKDIMNQVLVAEKKAQANVIMRREETASTRSLLNTAKLMEDNEMLFKLKEMEYLEKIAESVNGISLSGGGQVLEQLRDLFSKN